MRWMKSFLAVAVGAGLITALAGCPVQASVFRMWIVNTSDEYRVTSVEIESNVDGDTREILGDGMIAPNRTGVFGALAVGDLRNETITVTIRGVASDDKGVFDVETSVEIPDPVTNGLTVPIVVSGNTILTYGAAYYPLDDNAKLQVMLTELAR